MSSIKKDTNKMNEILQNFEITNQKLKEVIENLQKTQENIRKARKNFNDYNLHKRNEFLKNVNFLGIQSYQESVEGLEKQFNTCIVTDQNKFETIIFDKISTN